MKLLKGLFVLSTYLKALNLKLRSSQSIILLKFKEYNSHLKYSSMEHSSLTPPVEVKHMTLLDKNAFTKVIKVPSLTFDKENINLVLKISKKYILKLPKLNPILTFEGQEEKRQLILHPELIKSKKDVKQLFSNTSIDENLEFSMVDLTVKYENWKAEQILDSVLPDGSDKSSGYSIIGHILHLNLREHLHKYKWLIAQVYLDKIPAITMVVNKIDTIDASDNTFRSFAMEKLAGEENDTVTTVKENGCSYTFDFSKVYWNPRLSTEHERITSKLKENDVLFDIMSGVGPFSIPAAKKKCIVFANDLNPLSFESLKTNCVLNKVQTRVHCSNMDGKEFIKTILKTNLKEYWISDNFIGNIHIAMNLPSIAIDFLPSFIGLYSLENFADSIYKKLCSETGCSMLPFIHVYLFSFNETKEFAVYMVASKLGYCLHKLELDGKDNKSINTDLIKKCIEPLFWNYIDEVVNVRRVAPAKVMMRVSFHLPFNILVKEVNNLKLNPFKKQKCSSYTE